VFGIFTSRSMRERGKYQIQCMKSRSSTGVGMKVDLEYNIETMRITDDGGEDGEGQSSYRPNNPQPSPSDIMNKLKPQSTFESVDAITGEITPVTKFVSADVQGSKLKSLLNSLKK